MRELDVATVISRGEKRFAYEFKTAVPTVKLLHFCRKSVLGPRKMSGLKIISLSPLNCSTTGGMKGKCEKLLMASWDPFSCGTNCVLKYELSLDTSITSNFINTTNADRKERIIFATKENSAPIFNHLVVAVRD